MIAFECRCGAARALPDSMAEQKTRCPNCGAIGVVSRPAAAPPMATATPTAAETPPRRRKRWPWIVAGVVVVVAIGQSQKRDRPRPAPADIAKQADRDLYLDVLRKDGLIGKLELQGGVHPVGELWVTRKFYAQQFDFKQKITSVALAWCWCEDSDCRVLHLRDNLTGREVGTHRIGSELELD